MLRCPRRRFLRTATAAVTAGSAGCFARSDGGETDSDGGETDSDGEIEPESESGRDGTPERDASGRVSPARLRPRTVDPDAEYATIEVGAGDPTPVSELTVYVGDERYDPAVWAGDRETIGAGDEIRIRTEDVEPHLAVALRHDRDGGKSTTETTLMEDLRFEFEYDVAADALTVEYRDEHPLDGDHLHLVVEKAKDVINESPRERTVRPWSGETVTAGDSATANDVEAGQRVLVGWRGPHPGDAVASTELTLPYRVDRIP